MIDVAWILEVADYNCTRCGEPGASVFEDMAGLAAYLSPVPPLQHGVVQRMPRFGVGHVDLAALKEFRPVHRQCPRDRPPRKTPHYDLLASVR